MNNDTAASARRLAEFMLSREGQEVVTRAGFGALQQSKG